MPVKIPVIHSVRLAIYTADKHTDIRLAIYSAGKHMDTRLAIYTAEKHMDIYKALTLHEMKPLKPIIQHVKIVMHQCGCLLKHEGAVNEM